MKRVAIGGLEYEPTVEKVVVDFMRLVGESAWLFVLLGVMNGWAMFWVLFKCRRGAGPDLDEKYF